MIIIDTQAVLIAIHQMTDQQRLTLIRELHSRYCCTCGMSEHPTPGPCPSTIANSATQPKGLL